MPPTLLPPELEQFVQEQIAEGRFSDSNALVTEAVRKMSNERRQLAWLRQQIAEADESVAIGEWLEMDDEEWDRYFEDFERHIDDQPVTSKV